MYNIIRHIHNFRVQMAIHEVPTWVISTSTRSHPTDVIILHSYAKSVFACSLPDIIDVRDAPLLLDLTVISITVTWVTKEKKDGSSQCLLPSCSPPGCRVTRTRWNKKQSCNFLCVTKRCGQHSFLSRFVMLLGGGVVATLADGCEAVSDTVHRQEKTL